MTAALAARSSRNPRMMHLLRCLFFIKAVFEFNLTCITSQVLRIQRRMCCTGTTLLPFSLRCLGRTNTPHATGGSTIKSGTGLALDDLEGSLQLFFWQGLAESTYRTDSSGMSCFYDFCVRFSVSSPFPVSEKLLCYFNVILADEKLSFPTIKTYLAAMCDAFLTLGHREACHASSISRQASSLASQMYLDVPNYYVDWGLARVVHLGTSATNYLFRHKFQQTQSDYSLHNVM